MVDFPKTILNESYVMCPDREHICTRSTCIALGCQSPFNEIEKLANTVAVAVLNEHGTTTKASLREALMAFADAIRNGDG